LPENNILHCIVILSSSGVVLASFATFFHGTLSAFEITCLQSFIDHGHDITIFSYGDCSAPAHFKIADASSILPQSRLFYYKDGCGKGSVSGFSNLFRYTLLTRLTDIWWVDTDVVCLSSNWPERKTVSAAWQSSHLVGSAILYCAPTLAAELADRSARMGENISWGQAGPNLVTSFLREKELQSEALPASTFYPIPFGAWHLPFLADCTPEMERRCASAFALHLWHEMTRRAGFNKSALPDPRSFFGQLIAKHGTGNFFNREAPCRAPYKAWLKKQPLLHRVGYWARKAIKNSEDGGNLSS